MEEESQYTLPGVMRFLRSEWQLRERERIEWEIEKAEMRSRISRLEAMRVELQRERDEARRHLDILHTKFRPSSDSARAVDGHADSAEDEPGAVRPGKDTTNGGDARSGAVALAEPTSRIADAQDAQLTTDGVLATVSESRSYLTQCLADIRSILHQSGALAGDLEEIGATGLPGLAPKDQITLANFGVAASAVAILPNQRIAAGTVDGELLFWNRGELTPATFGEREWPVHAMRYSVSTNRLIAASGSVLQVFTVPSATSVGNTADGPRLPTLVASATLGDAAIVHVAISPKGNLIATVQEDGSANVWSLQGEKLERMSEFGSGIRVCEFAEAEEDVHLVLARGADPLDMEAMEGSLLLADPLTGQLLKKTVFESATAVSALMLTRDAIVLGTDGGDLRILGLARGEMIAERPAAHRGEITSLNLAKGDTLLSTGADGRVTLWTLPLLRWKGRLLSHDSGYGALSSSTWMNPEDPNSSDIAIGGGDGLIRVYLD